MEFVDFGFKFLLISFLGLHIVSPNKACIKLDATITQKIEHLGFHREINWLVEIQNLDKEKWRESLCSAAIMLELSQHMFVNPDQVYDMKRQGKLDIYIDGEVDIEAPSHEATRHTVFIFLSSSPAPENVTVQLPIHLRYQRSLAGGFAKVHLKKPNLLVRCQPSNRVICGKKQNMNAPANSKEVDVQRVWKNVTYKSNFHEMELLVPVGDLEHYPFVAIITCILGCVGCFYVLSLASY